MAKKERELAKIIQNEVHCYSYDFFVGLTRGRRDVTLSHSESHAFEVAITSWSSGCSDPVFFKIFSLKTTRQMLKGLLQATQGDNRTPTLVGWYI